MAVFVASSAAEFALMRLERWEEKHASEVLGGGLLTDAA
jgi:hypothetical protein